MARIKPIHYIEVDGRYACNSRTRVKLDQSTRSSSRITCKNCLAVIATLQHKPEYRAVHGLNRYQEDLKDAENAENQQS